jgi:hypothetical protein
MMFTSKELAIALEQAAKIREDSWNEQRQAYDKHVRDAAQEVCGNLNAGSMGSLVNLLLYLCWNDALEWARIQAPMLTSEETAEIIASAPLQIGPVGKR